MNFLAKVVASGGGFFMAIMIVPGITPTNSNLSGVVIISLVAGLINSIIGPVVKFFTLPLIFFTAGIALLFINMLIFWLIGWLGQEYGLGFFISGMKAAFFGSIITSIFTIFFGLLLGKKKK